MSEPKDAPLAELLSLDDAGELLEGLLGLCPTVVITRHKDDIVTIRSDVPHVSIHASHLVLGLRSAIHAAYYARGVEAERGKAEQG
jgi:hypothetical protein